MFDFTNLYSIRKDLCDAIKNEDLNKLNKILLNKFINLNYIDNEGQTPLHRSCRIGNLSIVKLLISYGASINLTNRFGWYPIHIASYFGYTNIVLYLIEQSTLNSGDEESTNNRQNIMLSTSSSSTASSVVNTPESTPPSSPPSYSTFD